MYCAAHTLSPLQDDPDMEEEITPAVVACGSEYTASITRRGQLLTWGLGSRGELGHANAGEVCVRWRFGCMACAQSTCHSPVPWLA